MSRPGSAARSVGGLQSEEGATAGPSRSVEEYHPAQHFEGYRPEPPIGWEIGQGPVNGAPEGRLIYPMPGHPTSVVTVGGSSGMPRHLPHGQDEGDFLPVDDSHYGYPQTTPYPHHPIHPSHPHHPMHGHYMHGHTPYHPGSTSHHLSTSPTAMMGQHGHPMMAIHSQSPTDGYHMQSTPMPPHYYASLPPRRPGMQRGHSTMGAPRPPMARQYSLQPPPSRTVDPMGRDVFAPLTDTTPPRRSSTSADPNQFFPTLTQTISPTRALGPAPVSKRKHSSPGDPLITPQTKTLTQPPSSGSTEITNSSSAESHYSGREQRDEEHDSPTKPTRQPPIEILEPASRRPIIAPIRVPRIIGGRTSAKFAKVAEDPGVEGIPPGPRPTERPTPSFACIIGQAILKCKAGGLSLEHIYRYVETAYPYFKSGDGAWRNSVRHNLSIHKMFETIPRTEAYPPGKGGIWIIHEKEKCHWPSEDKFIKNFTVGHPHHHECRQTVHERAKENEAVAKARAEGREYVPKKGKKARKYADDGSADMVRANSSMSDGHGQSASSNYHMHHPLPSAPMPLQMAMPSVKREPETTPPPIMPPKILHPHPMLRQLDEPQPYLRMDDAAPKGTMIPPRFGVNINKRSFDGDEENVFTAPKRIRIIEPLPLAPIQQESVDDAYVTPERERQLAKPMMMGSAFKTPGLAHSASSPGSSPMPPTIQRTAQHPSALQQTWTPADMPSTSSPAFSLDAAFDIKPKPQYPAPSSTDDDTSPTSATFNAPASSSLLPKTPLTRSSAAGDRNLQRTPYTAQTPSMATMTPMLPPMTIGQSQSTPAWEIEHILYRLGQGKEEDEYEHSSVPVRAHLFATPKMTIATVPLGVRSPLTSTDPRKYASPKKLLFGVNVESTSTTPIPPHLANPLADLKAAAAVLTGAGPSAAPGDGSPKKSSITAIAAKIGRELRAERERTRSGEMKAGV